MNGTKVIAASDVLHRALDWVGVSLAAIGVSILPKTEVLGFGRR